MPRKCIQNKMIEDTVMEIVVSRYYNTFSVDRGLL